MVVFFFLMSFWAVDSMVALLISHCEMYALYPNTDENDCRVLSEESYTIRFEREREYVCVCVCWGVVRIA